MMSNNYAKIVQDNLEKLFENIPTDLADALPAQQNGDAFLFEAFGETCEIRSDGIYLGEVQQAGVIGILISLYALNAKPETCLIEPLKAFKDFPNSMPYAGAFVTHTQQILVPYVDNIESSSDRIIETLKGCKAPSNVGGDFSFMVYPLPKIALCYIFYEADEDFPASVTCLYSNNAHSFLPIDALADVGEYTSKKMLDLVQKK
ncbi:MAG: DUF3786 domain-containing protein [Desulfobacteraceae bacterium]|jgi:Domain of unknown function (DUF3786)|nr:DUF3786 domain-containing protein [Desulfobacteraceae bacterium]MDH3574648.1 DUF3786 domain-containing protein [Desulfobacteraceae bacterium]MDH3722240.1 DUF3786 domain-containing protein [Desulfobacteraceae bacterium]MDH3874377.1 DUF3786 domain-containing protein [Desulfobacteraceae bacterium]